jgi:hypothetical protein
VRLLATDEIAARQLDFETAKADGHGCSATGIVPSREAFHADS